MKETVMKKVVVEFEPAEEEAFDTVLDVLERMSYIFEEEEVGEIFLATTSSTDEVKIVDGMDQRAIQALEEILGVWK